MKGGDFWSLRKSDNDSNGDKREGPPRRLMMEAACGCEEGKRKNQNKSHEEKSLRVTVAQNFFFLFPMHSLDKSVVKLK